MDAAVQSDENLTCDECGRFGAVEFAGHKLCSNCYADYGAGCAVTGKEEANCQEKPNSQSAPAS